VNVTQHCVEVSGRHPALTRSAESLMCPEQEHRTKKNTLYFYILIFINAAPYFAVRYGIIIDQSIEKEKKINKEKKLRMNCCRDGLLYYSWGYLELRKAHRYRQHFSVLNNGKQPGISDRTLISCRWKSP